MALISSLTSLLQTKYVELNQLIQDNQRELVKAVI